MPVLSSTWHDVTCPACRKRLAEADHPNQRYAVSGFVSVNKNGHAVFERLGARVCVILCEADPRSPKGKGAA